MRVQNLWRNYWIGSRDLRLPSAGGLLARRVLVIQDWRMALARGVRLRSTIGIVLLLNMLQVFVLSNCADIGLIQKELSKVNGVDSGVATMDGTHDGIFNVHA